MQKLFYKNEEGRLKLLVTVLAGRSVDIWHARQKLIVIDTV